MSLWRFINPIHKGQNQLITQSLLGEQTVLSFPIKDTLTVSPRDFSPPEDELCPLERHFCPGWRNWNPGRREKQAFPSCNSRGIRMLDDLFRYTRRLLLQAVSFDFCSKKSPIVLYFRLALASIFQGLFKSSLVLQTASRALPGEFHLFRCLSLSSKAWLVNLERDWELTGVVNTQLAGPHFSGDSKSVGQEWDPRICISAKFPGGVMLLPQGQALRTTVLHEYPESQVYIGILSAEQLLCLVEKGIKQLK